MLVKTVASFALSLAIALPPAFAGSQVLDIPGPSLIVLEPSTTTPLTLETSGSELITLEESASRWMIAVTEPGFLVVHHEDATEVAAHVFPIRIETRTIRSGSGSMTARSLYLLPLIDKEEDHDVDPDPKGVPPSPLIFVPLIDKEEDHDVDPDPKGATLGPLVTLLAVNERFTRGEGRDFDPNPKPYSAWNRDWAIASAAVAELGPGWYVVLRGGVVALETIVDTH